MNECNKITEATYFLQQMRSTTNLPDAFQHNLSAFLSAARSVLQYALEEARTKSGGQSWYDNQVSNHAVLGFFKDKRDLNIHVKPLVLNRNISFMETANIGISDSLYIEIHRTDGTIEEVHEMVSEPSPLIEPQPTSSVEELFLFSDWSGKEDVISLSQVYLDHLNAFVQSGKQGAFITG